MEARARNKIGRPSRPLPYGRLAFESGDSRAAEEAANAGLAVAPKYPSLYIVKADALAKQHRMYEARQALAQGAEAAPDAQLLARWAETEDTYGSPAAQRVRPPGRSRRWFRHRSAARVGTRLHRRPPEQRFETSAIIRRALASRGKFAGPRPPRRRTAFRQRRADTRRPWKLSHLRPMWQSA